MLRRIDVGEALELLGDEVHEGSTAGAASRNPCIGTAALAGVPEEV